MEMRYYDDIAEVREAMSPERADELLRSGWELLSIKQLTDSQTLPQGIHVTARVIYILGKRR